MNLLPTKIKSLRQKAGRGTDDNFTDVSHLIVDNVYDSEDQNDEVVEVDEDDDDDDERVIQLEEGGETVMYGDRSRCNRCGQTVDGDTRHSTVQSGIYAAAGDNETDVCGKLKKKKPLRKRVRKRVWRAVRSGWKYFRRGMAGYATGMALTSLFMWGVNFNTSFRDATRRP